MWVPISFTSWWMTSSTVLSGCSSLGSAFWPDNGILCELVWRSACEGIELCILSRRKTRFEEPDSLWLRRLWRAENCRCERTNSSRIFHRDIYCCNSNQRLIARVEYIIWLIALPETLRQHHELANGERLHSLKGRVVVFQFIVQRVTGEVGRVARNYDRTRQCRTRQSHHCK